MSILTPLERFQEHISHYYGKNKFTANASDWEIFLIIQCESKRQAFSIEKHIKRMKSSKYILNLVKYPEIIEKLKSKYIE